MTELKKPVSRRTTLLLDNRVSARSRDQITVTLHPDNTIGFRAWKCRREVRLPLSVAYKLAIVNEAKEKLARRQTEAKVLGKRIRKPRRSLLFN
jgi:hypothetical protein